MAAHNLALSMGLPSPTLTNPDLILPEATTRSFSPGPYAQRPPSPSSLLYYPAQTVKLSALPARRGPNPRMMSPPVTARSSVSTLPNIAEVEATPKQRSPRDQVLASSPTIRDSILGNMDNWDAYKTRRLSNASSSVHSEDLENMKWPGFEGTFDDSGVVLDEDEEHQGDAHKPAPGDEELDNDPWSDEQDENDDDPYSSAALSRRAEIILANAKKRLNVCARHSLMATPPPSSFNTAKMASELSQHLSAARDRDRQLYGGLGFIPPRQRPYHSSPLSTGSPKHSRVFSETSVPSPISARVANKANGTDRRSSSALGPTSGPWSPVDGYYGGHPSIRETKSQEVMRDHRNGWTNEGDHPLRKHSGSPTLEPLPENDPPEMPKLHRSASTTSDLRVQMNELKGKISTLKQRAREDGLRRRSLQSLRTPSPFTAAEIWYSGADGYKSSPISADAGVGFKEEPVHATRELYDEDTNTSSTPKTIPLDLHLGDQSGEHRVLKGEGHSEYQESNYEDAEEIPREYEGLPVEEGDLDDIDFVSVDNDDMAESIYEDAAYDVPVAARHEDRLDAFDYEHFFLHSAMGTYSSGSRRSSSSSAGSADSAETTRPITAIIEPADLQSTPRQSRPGLHQRNDSASSVSTMATFATATEGNGSDDGSDDANERLDEFSQRVLAQPAQLNGIHHVADKDRPESAINFSTPRGSHYAKESSDLSSQNSRGSSPGADIVGGLRASKIFSILLESSSTEGRRLSLNEHEKQLIYGLAASLQQVCTNLQSTDGDQYERKAWRRRLDEARKVLEGEEGDEAF
ncbi:uncharacterized protein BDZ99DRAFT_438578 [Mytilinidion resinicola]|uniref:Uncharacterized protein n=1 Tax=Mytilinidion resinicola TaxID=574789 RepID=A0A6A6YZI9_9PEZI|nr:uncharacterized protein BDZ99DRAFT_438578 [Mytilinidion resinicola]KAF2813424.1 hypothetical protein BDZ99DRAFT_438578 [Mytilinidion resinicola]